MREAGIAAADQRLRTGPHRAARPRKLSNLMLQPWATTPYVQDCLGKDELKAELTRTVRFLEPTLDSELFSRLRRDVT
jgi:hypothetical protein